MRAITQYLERQGYGVPDSGAYARIEEWLGWYRGKVRAFHFYRQYNGARKVGRERKSLGMAKKVAEDWANLGLNEKVEIVIGDEAVNGAVQAALRANNFRVRANQLLELAYALGTGAFVEYLDGGAVVIDYIRAGMIYPLAWENGEVLDCAFASETRRGRERLVYLNIHERGPDGEYIVTNRMFRKTGDSLSPAELPEGVGETVYTHSSLPYFQILRPNIVNNADLDCPMGISVFANAIDQLKGLDLIYDSYCNEFQLGKKRIIVPTTMARAVLDETGVTTPLFDPNDVEFYAVGMGDGAEQKIMEINMELRAEAHEAALKTGLNLLSAKCGLGNDRYSFERGGLKTATEVVSEKSELYQNLRKHELALESALAALARAVAFLLGHTGDFQVTVKFDDSIIQDVAAEKQTFLQEIREGVRQPWEYRAQFLGEDEAAAKAMTRGQASDHALLGFGADA